MLVGGIKPHLYCLPVLKRNIHQTSLIRAALGVTQSFSLELILLLTRDLRKKLAADVRAYSQRRPLSSCMHNFLLNIIVLLSLKGLPVFLAPTFYGQPRNKEKITLEFKPWRMPQQYQLGMCRPSRLWLEKR